MTPPAAVGIAEYASSRATVIGPYTRRDGRVAIIPVRRLLVLALAAVVVGTLLAMVLAGPLGGTGTSRGGT